jgi:hypothetical protein
VHAGGAQGEGEMTAKQAEKGGEKSENGSRHGNTQARSKKDRLLPFCHSFFASAYLFKSEAQISHRVVCEYAQLMYEPRILTSPPPLTHTHLFPKQRQPQSQEIHRRCDTCILFLCLPFFVCSVCAFNISKTKRLQQQLNPKKKSERRGGRGRR